MESQTIKWRSPSNIALVKYWGKRNNQIPQNPSVSFTLSQAHTETKITFSRSEKFDYDFLFAGDSASKFMPKLDLYFKKIRTEMPFLEHYHLNIDSHNSFPHSTGIASSASAMSALALCLVDFESQMLNNKSQDFYQRASYLSRLGSGSACRSVYPKITIWGKHDGYSQSSDHYASPIIDLTHANFLNYQDTILIISTKPKEISSSQGHKMMENHLYAKSRFHQANLNTRKLLVALKEGNLEEFNSIVEEEALALHALMMCSDPGYILMKPNTLKAIRAIKSFQKETKLPICFTLDAGPNIHLLYPKSIKTDVDTFIDNELKQYCENGKMLKDFVGDGPQKLNL